MLAYLGQLASEVSVLNVFRYITFRTAGATVTALVFVFLFGPAIITSLKLRQGRGQPIREDGPKNHLLTKAGTPTMGGLMILSGMVVSTLLWANLTNPYVWVVLAVTIGFGLIGFYDDYLKVTKANAYGGFSARTRLTLESVIAIIACVVVAFVGMKPFDIADVSFLQGHRGRFRLVLRPIRCLRDRRIGQCGEPDRRPGRPGDRAGDDRRRLLRLHRLPLR